MGFNIGDLLDPSATAAMNSSQQALNNTLASPYYNNAGNLGLSTPGSAGSALEGQAATLGATTIAPNTQAMTADAARLGGVSGLYGNLFLHGGPAEAAAVQQASSDISGTAQQNLRAQSRAQANLVSGVANSERGTNAAGATSMSANQAATNLQAFAYQAAANHANHQTALQAQAIQNHLHDSQMDLDQQLQTASQNAQGTETGLAQQAQNQTFKSGLGNIVALTEAGAGGLALGASQMIAAPPQTYSADASGNVGGVVASMPATAGGYGSSGYQTTYSTPVSRVAQALMPTTTPYSPTNTVYPSASSAGDWLTGDVGLSSSAHA